MRARGAGVSGRVGGLVVAFVGVTLLPLDTAAAMPDQTVVVRGGRIGGVVDAGALVR